jgi:hypothetical protein
MRRAIRELMPAAGNNSRILRCADGPCRKPRRRNLTAEAAKYAAALALRAKMMPVMIQTTDKFHPMGASPEHIVRFLQATVDEINSGKA